MAVNISDTKHFKKGEKLPDGTTAKRGVVWNTKTNKRVTGKVVMSASGQGGMGATKSYKAGRSVSAMKRAAAKKSAAKKPASTGKKTYSPAKPPSDKPKPPPAKKKDTVNTRKARDAAMAGRRGLTSTPTRSSSSSGYQAGTGGGKAYQASAAAGRKSQRPKKNWWEQGGGGLFGANSPFKGKPSVKKPRRSGGLQGYR